MLQLLEEGISQRTIALQLGISRNTVKDYYLKITRSGLNNLQLLQLSDADLSSHLYNPISCRSRDERFEVLSEKLDYFLRELKRTGVTRMLLWEEYCRETDHPYSYQQFCEHLNSFKQISQAVMHFEHKPGYKLQIDFAGDNLSYIDKLTGEEISCPVLVAVLPFSGFTYAEALQDASMVQMVSALNRCLEYIGGVPAHILSDNMKQYVQKTNRYEPSFTELTQQWSVHYNTTLLAARPSKPRDKPSVEKGVDLVYKRIYAPLRNVKCFSLEELNHHVRIKLELHNKALFQKQQHSRYDLLQQEKPYLKSLPGDQFELKHCTEAKVQKNYHVTLGEDWHHYSVPYQYIGKQIKIIYDTSVVEVFHNHQRIALHKRNYRRNAYTTTDDHMPEKHLQYSITKGYDPDYFINKAASTGEACKQVIKILLESRQFTEQTYNACLGILRLVTKYTDARVEAACRRALQGSSISYKTIENILTSNLDKLEAPVSIQTTIPLHDNIRGSAHYTNN